MANFVLIHGMGHDGWCWHKVAATLGSAGHTVVAPDLPLTSRADDAAATRAALDAIPGPKVLVGHSYGGLVISSAADRRDDVAHLVYVAAVLIPADANMFDFLAPFGTAPAITHMKRTPERMMVIAPEGAIDGFYLQCNDEDAIAALDHLRPTSTDCLRGPAGAEPWRTTPTTYVVCERDRAVLPDAQRAMAANATMTRSIDTDHSPFLSAPGELVEILLGTL
ncbi:MAG: alpha/beta fold hydrolase [Acidimicrobiia bacterium]